MKKFMAIGMFSVQHDALRKSLAAFDKVVGLATNFSEGRKKRATNFYTLGRYTPSVKDIQRTLD